MRMPDTQRYPLHVHVIVTLLSEYDFERFINFQLSLIHKRDWCLSNEGKLLQLSTFKP